KKLEAATKGLLGQRPVEGDDIFCIAGLPEPIQKLILKKFTDQNRWFIHPTVALSQPCLPNHRKPDHIGFSSDSKRCVMRVELVRYARYLLLHRLCIMIQCSRNREK